MLEKKQIDLNVQRALYRKIDALNRLKLTKDRVTGKDNLNSPFFIGNSLEPSDNSNPIEQHIFRSCFAKVCVAVPEKTKNENNESPVVRKPLSISSYLTQEFDENNKLKSIKNINTPLTFSEGISEQVGEDKTSNLFRGHSGITSIKVTQESYYLNKFQIGWVCPDPKFYEDVFSKKFLKLGAFLSIEFGWGIDDKDIELPSLTIEEMRKLVQDGVRERNLKSAGNYYCNVGQVSKFDWKVIDNGGYAGTLEVLSKGANVLLQPTQKSGKNSDETMVPIKNIVEKQRKLEALRANPNLSKKDRQEVEEQLGGFDNEEQYQRLIQNSVGFQTVMRNLDKVVDEYVGFEGVAPLGDKGKKFFSSTLDFEDNPYNYDNGRFGSFFTDYRGDLKYQFKDGAMRIGQPPTFSKPGANKNISVSGNENREKLGLDLPPETFANGKYYCSWGWFEDIILNSFFELQDGDITLQEIKSSKRVYNDTSKAPIDTTNSEEFIGKNGTYDEDKIFQSVTKLGNSNVQLSDLTKNAFSGPTENQNRCVSNKYLYSTGLDGVILPGKIHPILENGFKQIDDDKQGRISKYYTDKDRIDMMRVLLYYKAIDKSFKSFGIETEKNGCTSTDDVGIIRNMVFPIEMLQTHFQSMGSVRQGLRNFWAAVSNQYGGFWDFKVGQDQNQTTRVGVSELYHDRLKNEPSTPEDTKKQGTGRIVANLQFDKIFTFSVFSKDSIVKSFDVNLDLSEEASTLATYGHFTKGDTSNANTINDLPIEAWNILNQIEGEEDLLTKEQMDSFRKLGQQEIAKNVKFPIDNEGKGKAYEKEYKKDKPNLTELLNNDGLKFFEIKEIKTDQAAQMEKINNKRAAYVNGVGLYNRDGNLAEKFKQIMVYLVTKSKEAGSGSLIQKAKITLPISLSMSFDGIGGLEVGDCFKVDYLPKVYRENCFFMTTKVNHSVDNAGWTTDIEAMMVVDMENYWTNNQDKLNNTKIQLSELFRLSDGMGVKFEDLDVILNSAQGGGENYDAAIGKLNTLNSDFEEAYKKYQKADEAKFDTRIKKRYRLSNMYAISNEIETHFNNELAPLQEVLGSTQFNLLQRNHNKNMEKIGKILSKENKNYTLS